MVNKNFFGGGQIYQITKGKQIHQQDKEDSNYDI